jgi:hypothetical protein
LKFFLTAKASCSFCTLRFDLGRAIVGEKRPIPFASMTCARGFLKDDGVSRR